MRKIYVSSHKSFARLLRKRVPENKQNCSEVLPAWLACGNLTKVIFGFAISGGTCIDRRLKKFYQFYHLYPNTVNSLMSVGLMFVFF